MKIELIFDPQCPNVEATRNVLRQACLAVGIPVQWQEWDASSPRAPAHTRGFGSPTILIDGRDVDPACPPSQNCCRLYLNEIGRFGGVPGVEHLIQIMKNGSL